MGANGDAVCKGGLAVSRIHKCPSEIVFCKNISSVMLLPSLR